MTLTGSSFFAIYQAHSFRNNQKGTKLIAFDFRRFEIEERVSRQVLADKLKIPKSTVVSFWSRGSLKPETLKLMEQKLKKDLSSFITQPKTKKKGTSHGRKRKTSKAS